MRRPLAYVSIFILVLVAAPALFACEECNDDLNCNYADPPAYFCIFFVDGYCANYGPCDWGAVPLKAEYRVASVRVLEPAGKTPAALLAAAVEKPPTVVARVNVRR